MGPSSSLVDELIYTSCLGLKTVYEISPYFLSKPLNLCHRQGWCFLLSNRMFRSWVSCQRSWTHSPGRLKLLNERRTNQSATTKEHWGILLEVLPNLKNKFHGSELTTVRKSNSNVALSEPISVLSANGSSNTVFDTFNIVHL